MRTAGSSLRRAAAARGARGRPPPCCGGLLRRGGRGARGDANAGHGLCWNDYSWWVGNGKGRGGGEFHLAHASESEPCRYDGLVIAEAAKLGTLNGG